MAKNIAEQPLDETDAMAAGELLGLDNDSGAPSTPAGGQEDPVTDNGAENALEGLLSAHEEGNKPDPEPEKPATEEKPAAEAPKPAAEAPKPATEAAKPAADAPKPAPTLAEIDKLELGPHARPETRDQFAKVKELARQNVAEAEKKLAEVSRKAAELEEQVKQVAGLKPEDKTELEELRKFRRIHDIERDPQFQEAFDKRIGSNSSAIIGKLEELGVSKKNIEEIQRLGVSGVNWEPILAKVPLPARRFIEGKLIDNETALHDRKTAVEAAKRDAEKWEQDRKGQQTKSREEFDAKVIEHLNTVVKTIPWAHLKEVPVGASPEQTAEIESHNRFIREASEELARVVADESPKARAESALAVPMVRYYKAQLDAAQKKIAELQGKADELDRVKTARVTAKQTRGAPPAGAARRSDGPIVLEGADREAHLDKLFDAANR